MESIRVKDLMVPVEEYVTISETATLYEAVIKLEQAERDYEARKCPHRAFGLGRFRRDNRENE